METMNESQELTLAQENLARAKRNYEFAIQNMENCLKHVCVQEMAVERIIEEERGRAF